jgi:serine O-acetyltransferase
MSVINLIKQVREDYLAHGRDWTKPGFQAIAVHRFGTWKKTLRTKVVRAPMTVLADNSANLRSQCLRYRASF